MSNQLLQPGTQAPQIAVQDQDGNDVSVKDLAGKKAVIFIYPKDNTPTCTIEACNLRDNYASFQAKGYTVIGLSPDSPRKHTNFINKFDLPYPLWADKDHALIDAFGAWGEKNTFGKAYMGVIRSTFILDENGTIVETIEKVKAKEHTAQILRS